ncbi:hypothetical protein PAXRUDRAFT_830796, partial [Paxillus rubicundulus Ve08.2h10]
MRQDQAALQIPRARGIQNLDFPADSVQALSSANGRFDASRVSVMGVGCQPFETPMSLTPSEGHQRRRYTRPVTPGILHV